MECRGVFSFVVNSRHYFLKGSLRQNEMTDAVKYCMGCMYSTN